jgi:hypothetical protein
MITSESIINISKALLQFHTEVGKIIKTSTNPFFKSSYAALPEILDSIREPLIRSELMVIQTPTGNGGLTTRLIHTSGEWFEDTYFMNPVKNDPQSLGSLITYQRRYALGAILSLNIDEDDDGNKASNPKETTYVVSEHPEKLWLNKGSEEFTKAKQYLKDGGKMEQIKVKYKVSKEVEKLLTE